MCSSKLLSIRKGMTVTYANILEIIADQQERAEHHVEHEQDGWAPTTRFLKDGPALDAALARLDAQFAPDVASWIWSNVVIPADAWPILYAM